MSVEKLKMFQKWSMLRRLKAGKPLRPEEGEDPEEEIPPALLEGWDIDPFQHRSSVGAYSSGRATVPIHNRGEIDQQTRRMQTRMNPAAAGSSAGGNASGDDDDDPPDLEAPSSPSSSSVDDTFFRGLARGHQLDVHTTSLDNGRKMKLWRAAVVIKVGSESEGVKVHYSSGVQPDEWVRNPARVAPHKKYSEISTDRYDGTSSHEYA
jgi:hypothetical protein